MKMEFYVWSLNGFPSVSIRFLFQELIAPYLQFSNYSLVKTKSGKKNTVVRLL